MIKAFRQLGIVVKQVSAMDVPDLLCYQPRPRARGWYPVEVKMPGEGLRPGQQRLFDVAPFDVVESVEQVLNLEWAR